MRKVSRAIFAVALIGAMAFVLVACGGGSGSVSGGAGESSASESAAGSETPKEYYAITKSVFYAEDGSVRGESVYDRDEHGNAVTNTSTSGDNEQVVKYECDENGYTTSITQPDGETITYEMTLDGDKLLKTVGSNGAITEYAYHENGLPSEVVSSFGDEFTNVKSYDENGYLVEMDVSFKGGDSENKVVMGYEWELDEAGNPVSITVTEKETTENSTAGNLRPGKYAIECDANGNILKISDEDGNAILEHEYVKVDDPSKSCMLSNMMKSV